MSEQDEIRVGWRMLGLGWQTTSEVGGGLLLGWLIGKAAGNTDMWMAAGGGLGILVGLFTLIKGAIRLNKELDRTSPLPKANAASRTKPKPGSPAQQREADGGAHDD